MHDSFNILAPLIKQQQEPEMIYNGHIIQRKTFNYAEMGWWMEAARNPQIGQWYTIKSRSLYAKTCQGRDRIPISIQNGPLSRSAKNHISVEFGRQYYYSRRTVK